MLIGIVVFPFVDDIGLNCPAAAQTNRRAVQEFRAYYMVRPSYWCLERSKSGNQ
jgi:hypothetical protein